MPARGILVAAAVLAVCMIGLWPDAGTGQQLGPQSRTWTVTTRVLWSPIRTRRVALPNPGEPLYNFGNVLYRTEEYEEALQSYDKSLKHAEEELRSRGFFNRGNTAFQQRNYPDAVEAYKEGVAHEPGRRGCQAQSGAGAIPDASRGPRGAAGGNSRTNKKRRKRKNKTMRRRIRSRKRRIRIRISKNYL